jgi:tRNA(Ile)-lysidine synthase
MELLTRIRRTIRDHALVPSGARVVAGVSGGSDSVALAHLLAELEAAGDLRFAGIAHFNHLLRAAAGSDEQFVRRVADVLDRPCFVDRGDIALRARTERRSIEDAARRSRHEFFERARLHFDADVVALGHTRDDQAETFLLRLLRGAGPRGLAGMYARNGAIVRPLIDCRRQELREFLTERGIAFVEDESNADVNIPRNRVRAELLPLIEWRFNPAIVDVLADEAAVARDAWDALRPVADEISARIVKCTEHQHSVDIAELKALPPATGRLVLWQVMTAAAGGRTVGFQHVAAAARLLDANGPQFLDAPGHKLERIGQRLVLTGRPPNTVGRWDSAPRAGQHTSANLFRYPLSIPGEVVLAEAGCVVTAEVAAGVSTADASVISGNGEQAIVSGDLCRKALAVRNRHAGDRFRPVGLAGHKKLQDYFVDRKVARGQRDRVPIVVDDKDRIVWVAGYGIDAAFRVTDPAQAVLLLRLRRV